MREGLQTRREWLWRIPKILCRKKHALTTHVDKVKGGNSTLQNRCALLKYAV
jgi:hypothetical protein